MAIKYFITGGSGLLGSSLVYSLIKRQGFRVFASYREHPVVIRGVYFVPLDITNGLSVAQAFREIIPDVVIHTAALTNVDYCENNRQQATEVNVKGTINVAEACARIRAKMVYISTDFVFDGRKGYYLEKDEPNPINYYGHTKLNGEGVTRELVKDFLILRTTFYGWNIQKKISFIEWIIYSLQKRKPVDVFTDRFSSLMLANDCAESILKLIHANAIGLYHVASSERISSFDFANSIAEIFHLDAGLISPMIVQNVITTQKAGRPKDVSLNVTKTEQTLGIKLPTIKEGLVRMRRLKEEGYLRYVELK